MDNKLNMKINMQGETICDYYVDEKMKKVWQVELDILEKIIDICDKNNIDYSACAGTLLGAVRHKGYIPWDDDIDIVMKREQYEKFMEIAQKELKEPYFVQNYKTEDKYYRGHAQIRRSDTTAIIHDDCRNNYNKGIFVDIFVLDNVPDDEEERNKFLKDLTKNRKMLPQYYRIRGRNKIKNLYYDIFWKIHDYNKYITDFEEKILKYNNIKTKQCGAIGFNPTEFKYENSWFDEFIELDFEYLKVKCSKNYDEILTRQYGNYMEIPKNKNGTYHGKVFFDTEKSYKEYENDTEKIVRNLIMQKEEN